MQDDSIVEEWTINEESFGINTKEMATAAAAVSVNAYLLSTSDAEELCHESYLQ
jgi:hypothetical protein